MTRQKSKVLSVFLALVFGPFALFYVGEYGLGITLGVISFFSFWTWPVWIIITIVISLSKINNHKIKHTSSNYVYALKCIVCGVGNTKNSKYCKDCGSELKHKCKDCGKEQSKNNIHCVNCAGVFIAKSKTNWLGIFLTLFVVSALLSIPLGLRSCTSSMRDNANKMTRTTYIETMDKAKINEPIPIKVELNQGTKYSAFDIVLKGQGLIEIKNDLKKDFNYIEFEYMFDSAGQKEVEVVLIYKGEELRRKKFDIEIVESVYNTTKDPPKKAVYGSILPEIAFPSGK